MADQQIDSIKASIVGLEMRGNQLKQELSSLENEINRKKQELQNALSKELVGKYVHLSSKGYDRYGIIHSLTGLDTVKVMNISFTVNNKLDKTCESMKIKDLKFASEEEVKEYIFLQVRFRLTDNGYVRQEQPTIF